MTNRPPISDTLSTNIQHLLDTTGLTLREVERRSGVTTRMLRYVLKKKRTPTAQVLDDIASAFGLTGWHLMIPNLPTDLAKSGRLEKLMENYAASSEPGRAYIDHIAEHEARYNPKSANG